jgi:hypothetical protein
MKNIIKFSLFILTATLIAACETIDYGDTNVDPTGPSAAVTSQLLTNAESSMPSILIDETSILYMQHITQGQYPGASRYEVLTSNYSSWYTGPLQNLNRIIELNTDSETAAEALAYGDNNNQIAVARLLRAYYLQYMTDQWGALPWTDAFQGIDNPQPRFDSQQSIYTYLFSEVDAALAQINTNAAGPVGDVIFKGSMGHWKSFGNSLKMTMALRVSDADPSTAQSKLEQAYASGTLPTTNSLNLLYNYGTDDVSDSPWEDNFETREDYILAETMVESLRSNLDPRLFQMAENARDSVHPSPNFPGNIDAGFVGAPHGKVNGNVPDYSFITSDIIYSPNYPSPIYTAAQVWLSLAEAASKGWNVGGVSAADYYEGGILASMEYWGVSAQDAQAYIAAHPYSGIDDIAYEKWIALYLNGPEAWAEWRRLDAPALTPSLYASDQRIPVRAAYDSSVQDNNSANYADVVSSQGPDNLHTRLWWDVN